MGDDQEDCKFWAGADENMVLRDVDRFSFYHA